MGIHLSGAATLIKRLLDLSDTPNEYVDGSVLMSKTDGFEYGTALLSNPPNGNHPVTNIYVTVEGKLSIQYDDGL